MAAHIVEIPDSVLSSSRAKVQPNVNQTAFIGFSESLNAAATQAIRPNAGQYPRPLVDSVVTVVSNDAADTSLGIGAQLVLVTGFGPLFQFQIELVVMNGTTPVDTNLSFYGSDFIVVIAAGSNGTNVGLITASQGGTELQRIEVETSTRPAPSRSKSTELFIPAGFIFYLSYLDVEVHSTKRVDVFNVVHTAIETATPLRSSTIDLIGVAEGKPLLVNPYPPTPGPAIFEMVGRSTSGNSGITVIGQGYFEEL